MTNNLNQKLFMDDFASLFKGITYHPTICADLNEPKPQEIVLVDEDDDKWFLSNPQISWENPLDSDDYVTDLRVAGIYFRQGRLLLELDVELDYNDDIKTVYWTDSVFIGTKDTFGYNKQLSTDDFFENAVVNDKDQTLTLTCGYKGWDFSDPDIEFTDDASFAVEDPETYDKYWDKIHYMGVPDFNYKHTIKITCNFRKETNQ